MSKYCSKLHDEEEDFKTSMRAGGPGRGQCAKVMGANNLEAGRA